jgi:hypothetical protein
MEHACAARSGLKVSKSGQRSVAAAVAPEREHDFSRVKGLLFELALMQFP